MGQGIRALEGRRLVFFFFAGLGALAVFVILGGFFYSLLDQSGAADNLPIILPGISIILLNLVVRRLWPVKPQRNQRYQCSILSRDELAKARSKLMKKSTNGNL